MQTTTNLPVPAAIDDALVECEAELSPAVATVLRFLVERAVAVDEMVNGVGTMVDTLRDPNTGTVNVMKLLGMG